MAEARSVPDKDDGSAAARAVHALPSSLGGRGRSRARAGRRRGPKIDDVLDLHGQTVEAALRRLEAFVVRSSALRRRRLLVITGRGHGSPGGVPKVRRAVARWLDRERLSRRTRLDSYAPAPASLGGVGAFVLELA